MSWVRSKECPLLYLSNYLLIFFSLQFVIRGRDHWLWRLEGGDGRWSVWQRAGGGGWWWSQSPPQSSWQYHHVLTISSTMSISVINVRDRRYWFSVTMTGHCPAVSLAKSLSPDHCPIFPCWSRIKSPWQEAGGRLLVTDTCRVFVAQSVRWLWILLYPVPQSQTHSHLCQT